MAKTLPQFNYRRKEQWRGELVEARQSYIENDLFVLYPDVVKAIQEVKRRLKRTRSSGQSRGLLMLVSSGGGKSHFIKLLRKLIPDEETEEGTYVRVANFSIPGTPSPVSMAKALLQEIGDLGWNKGDDAVATKRALALLRDVGTWIVAIDDLQDVPERRRDKGIKAVGNWLRKFFDKSHCLFVLLGTHAAREVVRANPQLRRRFPGPLSMNYFSIDTPEQFARLKRFLHETDELLPLAEMSNLEQWAKKIYWASYGIADYIFKLFAEAVELAVQAGREHIDEPDLAGAFELVFLESGRELNPFRENGPQRVLNRSGEPFEDWFYDSNPMPQPTTNTKRPRKNVKDAELV